METRTCAICGEEFDGEENEDFCKECTAIEEMDEMHYGG